MLFRSVFRYSHGFYPIPVLARILPFVIINTDGKLFRDSSGQFFGIRTDSTRSRYWPGFYHFSVLAGTVFRYSHGLYLFPVIVQILPFFGTHTGSTLFRYLRGQFFDTRTDCTFSGTRPNKFSILTRILPFPGNRPNSTIFRYSHRFDPFRVLAGTVF